jgi:lysophospholipase L1-like esterase
MAGLNIDWATLKVTLPPGADDDQRATVNSFLAHPPAPQTGRLAAFRRTWFGRIIDLYRGSGTKIVFVHLPRGPIPRPEGLSVKLSSSIRELASRPNVILADEHAFDSIDRPELYKDGMHLNREGIDRFSVLLEKEIARLLGSPDHLTTAK